jgi:tRNA-methyltransferase O
MGGYEVRPVGWIESPLIDVATAPRQGDEGAPDVWVIVRPEFAAAVRGLEPGAEVVVLTWLHLARRDVLVVHPRDDPARPLTGVFATRSADRPNRAAPRPGAGCRGLPGADPRLRGHRRHAGLGPQARAGPPSGALIGLDARPGVGFMSSLLPAAAGPGFVGSSRASAA